MTSKTRCRRWLLALAVSWFAAGCSGGDGSGGGGEPTPTPGPSPTATATPSPVPTDTATPQFTIAADPTKLNVPQGGSATLDVTITPDAGFAEAVDVTVESLPSGVTASALTIAPPATIGTITLSALATAAAPTPLEAQVVGHTSAGARSVSFQLTVRGAPGALDSSFGTDGVARVMANLADVTRQPDGKLLVAGWGGTDETAFVCRRESNGTADLSFGDAGGCQHFDTPTAGLRVEIRGGMIYVAFADQFLARLTADGTPDPAFGGTGVVKLPDARYPERLRFDADGIVVSANVADGAALLRVRMDGTIDTEFAANHAASYGNHVGRADLVRIADGRLFLAGGNRVWAFHADGKPDASFGPAGSLVIPDVPDGHGVFALSVDGAGGLLAAGDGMMVTRFSTSGVIIATYLPMVPDPDAPGGSTAYARDLWVLDDGTMVLAGEARSDVGVGSMAIGRLLPDGARDWDFGPGGVHVYAPETEGHGIEVLPDGRYILVGSANWGGGLILRIWN